MDLISQNMMRQGVFLTTDANNDDLLTSKKGEIDGAYDPEMEKILLEMLDNDEEITARGVIRRHSGLKAASSITRNTERSALLAKYQAKQDEFQMWRKRMGKRSKDSTAMNMADKDIRIAELERQVELLTASHVAMIRAVGELGGFSKWAKFYDNYKSVREELAKMGALPEASIATIS